MKPGMKSTTLAFQSSSIPINVLQYELFLHHRFRYNPSFARIVISQSAFSFDKYTGQQLRVHPFAIDLIVTLAKRNSTLWKEVPFPLFYERTMFQSTQVNLVFQDRFDEKWAEDVL